MAQNANAGGESLSLQTLVIAAAASAAAAIVVSHVWKEGTVIAAAMTPVIVAIVKELLARPMESEIVRKPVQKIASSSRRVVVPARTGERARVEPRGPIPPEPEPGWQSGPEPPTDPGLATPIRTYGPARRRSPIHVKVALVTGLLAFVIAAAALTLPELLFGGAVSSQRDTTLFGGGGSKSDDKKDDGKDGAQPNDQKPDSGQTTPATPPPTTGGKTPTSTTPAPTPPEEQAPQQTTPEQTSPVPSPPTPPVP